MHFVNGDVVVPGLESLSSLCLFVFLRAFLCWNFGDPGVCELQGCWICEVTVCVNSFDVCCLSRSDSLLVLCKNPCVGEYLSGIGGSTFIFTVLRPVCTLVSIAIANGTVTEVLACSWLILQVVVGSACTIWQDSSELSISSLVPTESPSSSDLQYTSDNTSLGMGNVLRKGNSAWVGLNR